tara:strand:+ start:280 stop:546 length:267 start_codon:yes stop_codon:yes gene_type:complete
MPRQKGSKNKVTQEVKDRLVNLIDECMNSIDVNMLTDDQKIKLIQISLHYVTPKLRSVVQKKEEIPEQPLFVDVLDRNKETDEFEVTK